ncbi:hypothetical protein FM125_06050 [Micrococcus lylae]|uniref:Uncharacterized protein n=1 Tax=Micrococcus lylae TaxID=1273 RepID=A0A1R4J2P4_9MICC|nr:hypothetical protein FM125_06050 [Micrococcus lylae]
MCAGHAALLRRFRAGPIRPGPGLSSRPGMAARCGARGGGPSLSSLSSSSPGVSTSGRLGSAMRTPQRGPRLTPGPPIPRHDADETRHTATSAW